MNINKNYIGLDVSLSSTAMYILKNNSDGTYTEHYFNFRSSDKQSKWHKTTSYVNYISYEIKTDDNYSNNEVLKILMYNKITTIIINKIREILTDEDILNTVIVMEGYSYSSSNTTSLCDLVSYSTLLRAKLLQLNFESFVVKPPSTLKLQTCKNVYKPIEKIIKGKNPRTEYIYKNNYGISGGNFTKPDMLEALFDCKLNIKYKDSLIGYKNELIKMKNIPKPIDDIVDSIWLVWTEIYEALNTK